MAPGNSSGVILISGQYVQGPDSILEIKMEGTIQGAEYAVLVVDGNFTFDSHLDVLSIGRFEHQIDDMLDILNFAPANLSGTFIVVNLPSLASSLTWNNSDLLTSGQLCVLAILLGSMQMLTAS